MGGISHPGPTRPSSPEDAAVPMGEGFGHAGTRRCRLLSGAALTLTLGAWAIGQASLPAAAQRSCNQNGNPSAPPAINSDLSGQTLGAPPLPGFFLGTGALDGCNGADGATGNNGDPGYRGQPGGRVTTNSTSLTIVGGSGGFFDTNGVSVGADGGTGGTGGAGGYTTNADQYGGTGGVGGAGGSVDARIDGTFVADRAGNLATVAIGMTADGGRGGTGGDSDSGGIWSKNGGDSGPGGAGGSVTLVASGVIRAGLIGIYAGANGGVALGAGNASSVDQLDDTQGGNGGMGGRGGSVSVQLSSGSIATPVTGIYAAANGGEGGLGGQAFPAVGTQGGNGGAGGAGGTASAAMDGGTTVAVNAANSVGTNNVGILVSANGGAGGRGGIGGRAIGPGGGSGGSGGAGGAASATILGAVTFSGADVTGGVDGQAINVQANGGRGGNGAGISGGIVGQAGGGGIAGAGGSAALTLGAAASAATVRTSGNFAHGALVQSVGGGGGNGGSASFIFGGGSGGAGAAGGDGGSVTVTAPQARVIATGRNGVAVLAQSVGGGGGAGGDATDIAVGQAYIVGGNGGLGGNGGTVTLNLGASVFASTSTLGGAGVLAQSVSGSGGNGGSASSKGAGLISMVIGGDAGSGSPSGRVSVSSGALITTYGDHAAGIQAQSIGGGGGKAGSALSFLGGVLPVATVSVGGQGGGGGAAGDVQVTNTAQITTYGADAHGVLIQSIGGGGGAGGAAAARAASLSPSKYIPAISVSIAVGGAAGSGNTGGAVDLSNSGLILTAGDGSIGVQAQSVGGGGGTGGDSTAASYANGQQGGLTIAASVALGGAGGTGGTGGAVTLGNSGLIATLGQDAYGVFAQSVGGGGGSGGAGDATASSGQAKGSFSTSVSVSGRGGGSGHGGTIELNNSGAITTRGDGADAVFAQSVGGGGGAGGGGTATASGGNLSIGVGVGGSGGAGGNGNTVTVRNSGSIVTRGTDSVGILAQSIGGGGGKGGKGGATAGGVTPLGNAQSLFDTLGRGLGLNQQVQNLGDGILQIGQLGQRINATLAQLQGIFDQPQAGPPQNGSSVKINVAVSVGGSGGAAGAGGAVSATNTGSVLTFGAQSDGILAQSIGGGGGSGGGANSTAKANDDTPVQSTVAVGGTGGAGGLGGSVTVANTTGGTIATQGVLAMGIVAQSIGGGGGEGSVAGTVDGSLKSLGLGLGGSGGSGNNGGSVTVTTGDGSAGGSSITTTGKHGVAILAQSIGGGGGLVRTMTTDQTFDPSKIINNPQGRVGDLHGFSLDLGGQNGAAGVGGPVQVNVSGPINTSGLGAHAILAQSIGGGGGFVAGGQFLGPSSGGGGANRSGDGGNVSIQLRPGAAISTGGDGAYGILAQSIGGGGGFAGDPSVVATYDRDIPMGIQRSGAGTGGTIAVALASATVRTTGAFAPALFAQTLGGGGGTLIQAPGGGAGRILYRGSTGGEGGGGSVTVSLVGSQVSATGAGSAGILAQSSGRSSGAIQITLDSASSVTGGQPDLNPSGQARTQRDAAAIRILGGTDNKITNAGTIRAVDGNGAVGFAILADSSRVTLANTGTIIGDISIPSGGSLVDNQPGGVVSAPTTLDLGGGLFRNAGALQVGGIGRTGETVLTGNLVQTAPGRLVVETNHEGGPSDLLTVRGSAQLGGVVEVRPVRLVNRPVTVLTARDGLTLDPDLSSNRTPVFRYDTRAIGNGLEVQPRADFGAGGGLGANQRRLAAYLQGIWDRGGSFGLGFAALAGAGDAAAYTRSLDTLAGQTVSAIAAFRHASSHGFITNMLNDCATFEGAGVTLDEASCSWARVFGSAANQGSTSEALGYRTTAWNFQAGGQRQIAPGVYLGGTLAYENTQFRGATGTSRISGDSLLAGAILRYQQGPLQVAGVLDAGYGWYDSKRFVNVGAFGAVARARPEAWHVGAHGRIAYQIPFDGWYVQPRLDLHLTYVRNRDYAESGAGPFGLEVQAQGGVAFAAVPAVEVGGRIPLGREAVLRPFASAGLGFNAIRDGAATTRFIGQGGPGFRATTPIPDVLGKFTLGAEVLTSSRWDVRVQYSAEVGDRYASHTGMARLAYRF